MSGTIVPPDLVNLISELPADVAALIRELVLRGTDMSPGDLLKLLIALLTAGGRWETIAGIVSWLARMGLIDGDVAIQAIVQSAEVVVEAESGAAAAPVAAAGVTGATLAAILAALLAVIASAAAIGYELTRDLKMPGSRIPCGYDTIDGREMATLIRNVSVDAWGARRSYNQAIEAAEAECARHAAKCKGKCANGGDCKPTLVVENVEQFNFGFFTETQLSFVCPCGCA
jgi:hypothetical protein